MTVSVDVPLADGGWEAVVLHEPRQWKDHPQPFAQRVAFAAAHVVADARGVIDRRGDALVEWGPEARAWEARLWAELLRWRWAADIDPPTHDELLATGGLYASLWKVQTGEL